MNCDNQLRNIMGKNDNQTHKRVFHKIIIKYETKSIKLRYSFTKNPLFLSSIFSCLLSSRFSIVLNYYLFPIFPIITSNFSIFSVSSVMSDSLLLDCNSIFSVHSLPQTRTRVSSFCDSSNSIFCFSRNDFNEVSGVMISDLRELIYFSESNRFHLFALNSTFSSLITSVTILENVEERESNQFDKTEKFISDSNSDCICLLCSSICGVNFWIFSQRLPKA